MKKVLAIILALVLCMTMFACAKKPNDPADDGPKDYSTWPEKDIVINVNSKAGSSGDTMTRKLAEACEVNDLLNGHKIIINNIIDGTGYQTWKPVSEGDPDGYLLATLSTSAPSGYALGNTALPYDAMTYITGYFVDPQFVISRSDAPWNDFGELMDYIKAHPNEVNWGTASVTSADSVAFAKLASELPDYKWNRVTYDGGGEQLTALLGGFVDVAVTEYLDIDGQIKAGNLKIIGVMSDERVADQPNVKTLKECGYDIFVERARGFAGPLNMDPELVKRINEVLTAAWETDVYQEWMTQNCVDKRLMTGEEFLASYAEHYDLIADNLSYIGLGK